MPSRHHRTVDRIVAILELTARNSRGLSLSAISQQLNAPKTSVQELTNGLIATGYLVEREHKFYFGAGAFVLTLAANRSAAFSLSHDILVNLHTELGVSILAGIGMGDSVVYIDHVGDNKGLEFFARNHTRRSLFASASGKIILAAMPPHEMDNFVLSATTKERDYVNTFLSELPTIRRERVAYNFGATIPTLSAVATPLCDSRGDFVAAISAPLGHEDVIDISVIGPKLRDAVARINL